MPTSAAKPTSIDPVAHGCQLFGAMGHANNHLALCDRLPDHRHLVRPMRLADGSLWSVQASSIHMCLPQTSLFTAYDAVEVTVLEGDEPADWAPWLKGEVYGWLPVERLDAEADRRGGPLCCYSADPVP